MSVQFRSPGIGVCPVEPHIAMVADTEPPGLFVREENLLDWDRELQTYVTRAAAGKAALPTAQIRLRSRPGPPRIVASVFWKATGHLLPHPVIRREVVRHPITAGDVNRE